MREPILDVNGNIMRLRNDTNGKCIKDSYSSSAQIRLADLRYWHLGQDAAECAAVRAKELERLFGDPVDYGNVGLKTIRMCDGQQIKMRTPIDESQFRGCGVLQPGLPLLNYILADRPVLIQDPGTKQDGFVCLVSELAADNGIISEGISYKLHRKPNRYNPMGHAVSQSIDCRKKNKT